MARANEDTSMSSCKRTCIFRIFRHGKRLNPRTSLPIFQLYMSSCCNQRMRVLVWFYPVLYGFTTMALSLQVSRAVSARKMRSNFTSRLAILSKYVCMCEKWGSTNNYAGCNGIWCMTGYVASKMLFGGVWTWDIFWGVWWFQGWFSDTQFQTNPVTATIMINKQMM